MTQASGPPGSLSRSSYCQRPPRGGRLASSPGPQAIAQSTNYFDGQLPDGTTLPLCRLRYAGSAHSWRFAIYRASHDDYEPSILPAGYPAGNPQEALDCACRLYLADPTVWLSQPPPTN